MRRCVIISCLSAVLAGLICAFPMTSQAAPGATAEQYYAAGAKLYTARNYTQALQYLGAAIKLNPRNVAAYQLAGNCYYALGNKRYALAYYQRASALQPNNAQLAQFVRNLQTQVAAAPAAPAAAAPAAGMGLTGANPLSQGSALFQQKQYAASIPYFLQAAQQTPNDYRPYYYAGYAYYMTRDARNAALYFGVANLKQPNASIKAYADRIKASLPAVDQQWVDGQLVRFAQGPAVAAVGKAGGITGGFHILGGIEYLMADPTAIIDNVKSAYAGEPYAGCVSLSGTTPNVVGFPQIQPFVQIGDSFEINLGIGYFPVGNMSYTTIDYSQENHVETGEFGDVWKYTFNTTVVTVDLGVKILFGDKSVKGYLGVGGGISPITMKLLKIAYDPTVTVPGLSDDMSSGDYSTMAVNAQAILGVDFAVGKGVALGPYVGYRYLSATDFKNSGSTLVVDTVNGAVGVAGSHNMPQADPVKPLTLDFSGIEGGLNLTFSF